MAYNETLYRKDAMFAKKNNTPSKLDQAIDAVFADMSGFTSDSDEYNAMTDQLDKLYKLKEIDTPKRVSPDTLALVTSNIVGILIIVGHERAHIIASKALMFVAKPR